MGNNIIPVKGETDMYEATFSHSELNYHALFNETQLLPVVSPWEGRSESVSQLHSCNLYKRNLGLRRRVILNNA